VTKAELYPGMELVDIYQGVTRSELHPNIPENTPPALKFIMEKCFEQDPQKRPVRTYRAIKAILPLDSVCINI
jgi:hypothetical protein